MRCPPGSFYHALRETSICTTLSASPPRHLAPESSYRTPCLPTEGPPLPVPLDCVLVQGLTQLETCCVVPCVCCRRSRRARRLAGTALEGLAEHEKLNLVIDGQNTSTGNTTEDVSTGTLEEGSDTLSSHDLGGGIEGALVLDGLQN